MKMKLPLQEAKQRVSELMNKGYHCGPAVMQVMWETANLENEDLLWASTAFLGGIAQQNYATCGAISSAAIFLGLSHCTPLSEKEKAKQERTATREEASELVKSFINKFGTIICHDLLALDLSKPEGRHKFQQTEVWKDKCNVYAEYVIEKLYEINETRGKS